MISNRLKEIDQSGANIFTQTRDLTIQHKAINLGSGEPFYKTP